MSEVHYNGLLVAANLASVMPNAKMKISHDQWESFLIEHGLAQDKVAEKIAATTIDLAAYVKETKLSTNRKDRHEYHILRVGDKTASSANKFSLQRNKKTYKMFHPIVVPSLRKMQRSLARMANRAILDAIIDNAALYKAMTGDDNIPLRKQHPKEVTPVQAPAPESPAASALSSRQAADDGISESPLKRLKATPPAQCNTNPIEEPESIIPVTPPLAQRDDDDLPLLRELLGADNSFNPTEPKTAKKIDDLLAEITKHKKNGFELNYKDSRHHDVSYVRVPKTSNDHSFNNQKGFLDDMIRINGSRDDDEFGSACRVVNHMIRFYKDSAMAALEKQGIPVCEPMSETQFAAMLQAANINGVQQEQLSKHLRYHLGKNFCPTRASVAMLCEGHAPVHCNSITHTYKGKTEEETVEYSEKDMDTEITIQLARLLQSKDIDPKRVKRVQVVSGGDHGDIAFQFGATVSVELDDDTVIDFEVSVCEVICRTDTADLLEKTILPRLTKGLKTIATKMLHIYTDLAGNVNCCFGSLPENVSIKSQVSFEKVKVYVTGDLACFAMILGRESMSGQWCFLCRLSRSQYSNKCHEEGELWTTELLKELGDKITNTEGNPDQGIKKAPWWEFLPLHHYMIPLLHALIGIGNDLLDNFFDHINEEIEDIDVQEYKTRKAIVLAEHKIIDTISERDEWDLTPDGKKLHSLKGVVSRRMKAIEKLGALITIAQKAKETNQDAPLDSVELIHQFGEFVDIDFDDAEEDVDDVGEEISEDAHEVEDEENENTENEVMADSEVSIDIPSSLDVDVKAKIQSHFAIIQQAKLDLLPLASERKEIADCLKRTRAYLALLKKSKRAFRSDRKKQSESLESQMFKVLKSIGVELTRYHGGSLMARISKL